MRATACLEAIIPTKGFGQYDGQVAYFDLSYSSEVFIIFTSKIIIFFIIIQINLRNTAFKPRLYITNLPVHQ